MRGCLAAPAHLHYLLCSAPRLLGDEREETPRIVHHDGVKHVVTRASGLDLRNEHGQSFGVTPSTVLFHLTGTRNIGSEHQVLGEACLQQRHDQRYLLGVTRTALTVKADERSTPA